MNALRRFAAEDRPFALLFLLLTALYLLPIVVPRHLPLQDYAAHLRIVALWQQAERPGGGLMASEHLRREQLSPYGITFYGPLRAMARFISLEAAQKLLLIIYATALPLSYLWLLLAVGRDRRYSLLVFPFIYSTSFILGLLPQAIGLPFVLTVVAALKGYLDQQPGRATWRRELLLAVLLLLTYLTHFVSFLAAIIAVAVVLVAHVRRPSRIARRALFVLPALCLALLWSSQRIGQGGLSLFFSPPLATAAMLCGWFNGVFQSAFDEWVLAGVLLTSVVCLLSRRWPGKTALALPPPHSPTISAAVAGLALLLAVFALPTHVLAPAMNLATNMRLALPALLLMMTLPSVSLRGRRSIVLLPALGLIVWSGGLTLATFCNFDRQARHFEQILHALPANKRVLPLPFDPSDGVHTGLPLLHFSSLYQVRKGGYLGLEIVGGPDVIPVRLKGGGSPAPHWSIPWSFNYALHGPYYHYLLAIFAPGQPAPPTVPGATETQIKHVLTSGRFALYRNVGPLRPPG